MLILTGNNLDERHKELNAKVNEAAAQDSNFDVVKDENENSDVDRLFKIKLASKLKKMDYIVSVLTSGDSLYISHALKCIWIYNDEHSNIINPDYLHHNIFPLMSLKMKNKMLSVVSMHVRKEERTNVFFEYCLNTKLYSIAIKFLPFVPESSKLDIILNKNDYYNKLYHAIDCENIWQNVIGKSFKLAEAKIAATNNVTIIHTLRHLYFIDDNIFLGLLEKYVNIEPNYSYYRIERFGTRLSKDIVKKHRDRILLNPKIYVNLLKTNIITKHFPKHEAKILISGLLPNEADNFWNMDFCSYYKDIINIIPFEERFEFIKKIFCDKYPTKIFDNFEEFHNLGYYAMMSTEQKDSWASKFIEIQDDVTVNRNYVWYRFIEFRKSFKDIKKYIMATSNQDLRSKMLNVLPESAKTQEELEILLKYYYQRHINENIFHKESFIDKILEYHNIFTANDNCWAVFYKILCSFEASGRYLDEYKVIPFFYKVINNIEVPTKLHSIIDRKDIQNLLKYTKVCISDGQKDVILKYSLNYYTNRIQELHNQTYNDDIKKEVVIPIENVLNILYHYGKGRHDIPEFVMDFIELNPDKYKFQDILKTESKTVKKDLKRLLKKDATLVISELSEVKNKIERYEYDLKYVSKKLKIYFSNDIAKDYLQCLLQIINNSDMSYRCVNVAVYNIFQVADKNFISEFMSKNIPEEPKIDHCKMDSHLLHIQEAICRFAGFSRPPVDLSVFLNFIKGDYVHYCLPVFNTYHANLTQPQLLEFIQSIIDTPLSIQKHAIRLATKCQTTEKLSELLLNVWKKTKNVTFRVIIYNLLYNKVILYEDQEQKKLFEVLKTFILDLNEEDDDAIFDHKGKQCMQQHLRGEYIATFWEALSKLPEKHKNIIRMTKLIEYMTDNINILNQDFVKNVVNKHVQDMLIKKQIRSYTEYPQFEISKWTLVEQYIFTVQDQNDEVIKLDLVRFILNKCFEMWNDVDIDSYTLRKFCINFVRNIQQICISYTDIQTNSTFKNTLLECLIKLLLEKLSVQEIYLCIWDLRLTLITRKTMYAIDVKFKDVAINYENLKELLAAYSNDLIRIINEYTYVSLISKIASKVAENIEHINNMLSMKYDMNKNDLFIVIAGELLNVSAKEPSLIALKIFPYDYVDYKSSILTEDAISEVLTKFKLIEDTEVQINVYQKFVNSDFKKRKYF